MQTSPDMKKPSRLLRRATRLAMCVAAASAAACSPPHRQISVQGSLTGTSLTVRTDAPVVTRHVRIRVSTDRAPSEPIDLHLHGGLISHWRPDDPTEQRKPLIRARLDGFSEWGTPAGFGIIDDMSSANVWGARNGDCDLQQAACEWLVPLDIEVQPRGTTGAVDVRWFVSARADVRGNEDLPGFTVQVTEE